MPMAKEQIDKSCADFQAELPHLMESGADLSDNPHLRDCQTCADLVRDLEYIAAQAKLLLPLQEPSPQVWNSIKSTLSREGLMDGDDGPGLGPAAIKKKLVQARH